MSDRPLRESPSPAAVDRAPSRFGPGMVPLRPLERPLPSPLRVSRPLLRDLERGRSVPQRQGVR